MNISLEHVIQQLGGALAYAMLAIALYGIWRGTQRQPGRMTGRMGPHLRSTWFYLASSVLFFTIAWFGWVQLPIKPSPLVRAWMLSVGSVLYFPGMLFTLWGRLALGKNYFVSTGFGAQLFEGHQLITSGPYAVVRHPMYTGLIIAAIGSLLIYFTWTTLYFALFAPLTMVRAWREEQALEAEFGEQWRRYREHVPAFIPYLRK